ncbi:MAG TPA: hypothetical protein EYG72_00415 [Candidatus Pacebacteria bacterium]|nr:hypothetical protein [Candidatus Paceibacterota bacterium]
MYYLTKEKKKELGLELEHLIINERIIAAKNISSALSDNGNMAENNDFMIARDKKEKLEIRISHLEDVLKNSEIVKDKIHEEVEVGATVIICKDGDKRKKIFKIVGREEFDIKSKKIPLDSPLAKSMMGKKEGEKFEFFTPNKKKNIYIIKKIT